MPFTSPRPTRESKSQCLDQPRSEEKCVPKGTLHSSGMGRSCDDERQVEAMVAPRTSSSRDKSGGLEIELIKDSSSCLKARGVESSVQPISKEALYVGSSSQKEMSNSSPEVRELKQSDHKPKSSLCKAEIVSPSNARGVGMNLATHEEKPELLKRFTPKISPRVDLQAAKKSLHLELGCLIEVWLKGRVTRKRNWGGFGLSLIMFRPRRGSLYHQ
ncbi:hypothetical protein CDL15_Pgr000214 [Punica granatum]|uniref:Uncharacterized protein n=1 Tax=Punica granatum TaxID=22663 RepID=A0A218Y2D5_PUNGR|nr:hypothetical protein CDL15_Pgr000214 [Punica granatum]